MAASTFPAVPCTLRIPPFSVRVRTAVAALATLARDPGRLDQVLVLSQAVNLGALTRALGRLGADPEGLALLAEQPRLDRSSVDWDSLERLPDGTLGREYVRFLRSNGISPEPFEALPDLGDARAAWVMLRLRQTHDLWHVLTGYAPDVRGELLLQAFTYAHLRAPSALLIAVLGSLRWAWGWKGQLAALRRAYRLGARARFLATFRWEDHWATPLSELRARLGVTLLREPQPIG
jgi:ubiquinone biosynthesis protein COQ4